MSYTVLGTTLARTTTGTSTYTVPANSKLILKRINGIAGGAGSGTNITTVNVVTGSNTAQVHYTTTTTASYIIDCGDGNGGAQAAASGSGINSPVEGIVLNAGDTITLVTNFGGSAASQINISGVLVI